MADYVLEGPKWGTRGLMTAGGTVTWAVDETVPLSFIPFLDAAFDDWSIYGNIQFQVVDDTRLAQIDITFGAIDGAGGVLGETSYRYSGTTFTSAAIEFDSSERWQTSGDRVVSNGGADFSIVALHEIGHAIGLDHYNTTPAVMNAFIRPSITDLAQPDINGIKALYGAPAPVTPPGLVDIGSHSVSWSVAGVGDFNADGTSDILWRNAATGSVDQWQMKDGHWSQSIGMGSSKGAEWQFAGTGDFNADSFQDVLWLNARTGHLDEWQMNNGRWAKSIDVGNHPGSYTVAGVGDFNADGATDVLWRDAASGSVDQWQLKNGQWSQSIGLGNSKGVDWKLAGIGDFNADGNEDVLWFNTKSGQVDEWVMKGGFWSKSVDLGSGHSPTDWQVAGVGDFNRDGTDDVKWLNQKTGDVDVWHMAGGLWAGSINAGKQGLGLTTAGVGDFNHDGTSDTLFLNASDGELYGHYLLT